MNRTKTITLLAVSAVVAAFSSCSNENVKRCVDKKTETVVADSCCNPTNRTTGARPGFFHWYYGGRGYGMGDHVANGSYSPVSGKSYTPAGHGVSSRGGGFGSTGKGST